MTEARGRWGLEHIRNRDPERAKRLEEAGSPDDLIEALRSALDDALENASAVRLAVDGPQNDLTQPRAIIQFGVSRPLYDWFYNGPTGYRAQFLKSEFAGGDLNARIVRSLSEVLRGSLLGPTLIVRRIHKGRGEDIDRGETEIASEQLFRSLDPQISKVWICERPITGMCGQLKDITDEVVLGAEAEVQVDGWTTKGRYAPYPGPEHSWLDLKGGFVGSGKVYQIKSPEWRACNLHKIGWT